MITFSLDGWDSDVSFKWFTEFREAYDEDTRKVRNEIEKVNKALEGVNDEIHAFKKEICTEIESLKTEVHRNKNGMCDEIRKVSDDVHDLEGEFIGGRARRSRRDYPVYRQSEYGRSPIDEGNFFHTPSSQWRLIASDDRE